MQTPKAVPLQGQNLITGSLTLTRLVAWNAQNPD